MDMPARTPGEPVADRLRLVGRVVVHDDVDVEVGRNVGLDVIQETSGTPRCGGAGGTVR